MARWTSLPRRGPAALALLNDDNVHEVSLQVYPFATVCADAAGSKIRRMTIAPLIAEAIKRIADESSVSSLFD